MGRTNADRAATGTTRRPRAVLLAAIAWTVAACAAAGLYAKAVQFGKWEHARAPGMPQPRVYKTRPAPDTTDVLPNTAVAADVFLPNVGHGIASSTMNTKTIHLYQELADGTERPVEGHVNTSGGRRLDRLPAVRHA